MDTERYERDCRQIIGRMIHHDPDVRADTLPLIQARRHCMLLMEKWFNSQENKSDVI